MVTLSQLLLPSEAELTERLRKALLDRGVVVQPGGVGRLPMLAWRMMPGAVARQLATLLDFGLGDVLVGGWNKSYALRQHLRKSRQAPGKDTFLALAEHKLSSKHAPYVALLKDGQEVARLPFAVSVELVLQGAVLRVRDGAIREIQLGQVKGKGKIACGGAVIVERELPAFDVPGTLKVDAPGAAIRTAGA